MIAARSPGERGQATVELVALLPVLVAVALSIAQLLAAGVTHELAGTAAQAGAMALLQGGDPEAAAREAVPGWSRRGLDVLVRGRTVRVTMRPLSPVPAVADGLATTATGDAGPRAAPR